MEEHTKQQIDSMRDFLIRNEYPNRVSEVGGRNLDYYIVPQSLNPELPDFVARASNKELGEIVMALSESIPQRLQPFFALSEYIEFMEKEVGYRNRVMEAENETISYIPEGLKKEYLERKVNLFSKELENDRKNPQEYLLGEDGRQEFNQAIDYLRGQLNRFS